MRKVDIDFYKGTVSVNGRELDEPYVGTPTNLSYDMKFPLTVLEGKIEDPLVKEDGRFREADYHEATVLIAKRMQTIGAKYGKDAIAVAISDRYTNEEAYAMKRMAEVMGAKVLCMNNRANGLAEVLGFDASPNTIDELLSTNVILRVGFEDNDSRVISLKMKQAAEAGANVINLCNGENDLGFLKEIAKAITCGRIT